MIEFCIYSWLTILLSTERVLLIVLIVWGCSAPELPICTSVWGAGVVGLSHEDKGEHTRLAIRVSTVHLVPGLCRDTRWTSEESSIFICLNVILKRSVLTPLLTADSISQTGTEHLLIALVSDPALFVREGGPWICAAGHSMDGRHDDGTCATKRLSGL